MTEWYDSQFNEERAELADLEYSEVLISTDPEDEIDEGEEICTCEIDENKCLLHQIKENEEISTI